MVPGLTIDMFNPPLSLAAQTDGGDEDMDVSIPDPDPADEDMGVSLLDPTIEGQDVGVLIARTGPGDDEEPEHVSLPPAPAPDHAPDPDPAPVAEVATNRVESPRLSQPGDFWPHELDTRGLPSFLQGFSEMFKHVWPIKSAGDDRHMKLVSPISSFLNSQIPKGQPVKSSDNRRIVVSKLLMTLEEMMEDSYPLHSSQKQLVEGNEEDEKEVEKRRKEGWVETDLSLGNGQNKYEAGAVTEGKTIYAIDCEMCKTAEGLELTRISVLNWDAEVVYDTFVKPTNPITDYVTQYSGITAELLNPITTTLADVQARLLTLFNNDTILVGQSLNSDLTAMRLIHPHIVDTSVIYHHPRGPPYKPALKWLAHKHLRRAIQNGGAQGHNPTEDAKACLDLLKLKLERGKEFGTVDGSTESIFKRLGRYPVMPKKGAVVDYGHPEKWHGAHATRTVTAKTDLEVVDGVLSCAAGAGTMDFTWGRLRSLEILRGWHKATSTDGETLDPSMDVEPDTATLAAAVEEIVRHIKKVHDGLPKNTAFIVYSGTGDPREMRRLLDMQKEFRSQYQVKKWDEISVKWTDTEEQKLKAAVKAAREGLGFMTVT